MGLGGVMLPSGQSLGPNPNPVTSLARDEHQTNYLCIMCHISLGNRVPCLQVTQQGMYKLLPCQLACPAGEEVTISYLGAPQLLPLDGRRQALSGAFGFNCACPRCVAEEDIPDSLAELMQDIGSRVGGVRQGVHFKVSF